MRISANFLLPGTQGAGLQARFAVCFLRNARAGLRIAQVSTENVIFDPFLHYILMGTPFDQRLRNFVQLEALELIARGLTPRLK
ncbi:hypothetical protein A2U01_0074515 [Trifolium medium]|uniref:Uncharacterized protein n=1 Tax=Trifolium medium TaxID=97028 RepID=A0A392SX63_9FABA|nr:hypothetical protein [Trifolium medium]